MYVKGVLGFEQKKYFIRGGSKKLSKLPLQIGPFAIQGLVL
jgi:hypothetical protein